ncbi:hypothetical protein GCM10027566_06190 [Arachidicoccus ginsenosidivorans]|uniref:ABC transporter permease subunit n=1 Tax=Arachidicoccus ginsenosidivorans TaxID=496057 RepID=A0A5B8VTB3_9BACT|nr:Gldg family protein [Arachidicoccus ginsenosidivorans]QEC74006.1 ABC transporter permease subunit [Arachidicoccus ginsenosidivorans]
MKLIGKIAKTELRNLFYSPIAWFLTVAFLVQCAITYTSNIHSYAVTQEMGGIGLHYMKNLTYQVFNNPYNGLFGRVMQNLYLYIPLLTMGLISREMNGGTISLLYSSPVKVRQIVLGKYLAMMIYSLVLVAVVGIFILSGIFDIRSADYGMLLSAALGFYLLLCVYSAIGLFMSCLTTYQVVAAISSFVMIGILSYIGKLWQGIDFVRDLTYFLSLQGRTQHMLLGLITTKDVLYFVLISAMFLAFAIFKLRGDRETRPWYTKALRYTVIVIVALCIGYISSRPALIGYWDTTANNINTLTPNAQKIIKEFGDSTLEVTAYSNYLDNFSYLGDPERRNDYLSRWEIYLRFKPDIKFHYQRYYDSAYGNGYNMFQFYKGKSLKQIAEQRAKGQGLDLSKLKTPAEMHKIIDLRPELNRFVMRLQYKGRSTYLRVFNDQMVWPSETEVSAAFKRLLQAKMPKIVFITGQGERNVNKKGERHYRTITNEKTFRYALLNQGFDVDTVSLETQDIPDCITALVLADPVSSLSQIAFNKIQQYINNGGNMMIMGEPGRQQLINPLLKSLGVQMQNGMLEEPSEDYAPMFIMSHMTKTAIGFSKALDKPSVDTLPVTMNGITALNYVDTAGFKVAPLLVTTAGKVHNTRARNPDLDLVGTADTLAEQQNQMFTSYGGGMAVSVVSGDNASSNPKAEAAKLKAIKDSLLPGNSNSPNKTYTPALALTRQIHGKQQRIVVTGDADFMSNGGLVNRNMQTANFLYNTALFSWLDDGKFPIDTSRPDGKDIRVTVSTDHVGLLKIIYIWILPAILLIFGTVLLVRRKRK